MKANLPVPPDIIDAEFTVIRGPRVTWADTSWGGPRAEARRRDRRALILCAIALIWVAVDGRLGVTHWLRAHSAVPAAPAPR